MNECVPNITGESYNLSSKRAWIFSMGNENEKHGPALPLDIDSRVAKRIALSISEKTGANYCGHFPFSTDQLGEIAKLWSPNYLDYNECLKKLSEFLAFYLNFNNEGKRVEFIFIINAHGGNSIFKDKGMIIKEEALKHVNTSIALKEVYFINGININKEEEQVITARYGKRNFVHADTLEHSIAKAIGCIIPDGLIKLNTMLATDIENTLTVYPEIGGLLGYREYIPKMFFMKSYKELLLYKKIEAIDELGKEYIRISVENIANHILDIISK